jgi:hypothetical protein
MHCRICGPCNQKVIKLKIRKKNRGMLIFFFSFSFSLENQKPLFLVVGYRTEIDTWRWHEKPERKNFPFYRAQRVSVSETIPPLFIGKGVFG